MMHCYLLLEDAVGVGVGPGDETVTGRRTGRSGAGRGVVPLPSSSSLEELGPRDMYVGLLCCMEVLVR